MTDAETKRGVRRWAVRESIGTVFAGALVFGLSGRLDWPMGWALVAVYAATFALQALLFIRRSPGLLAERANRFGPGTKRWDKVLLAFYGQATLGTIVVAGLGHRFGWPGVPAWAEWLGLGLAVAGNGLVIWAMAANAYFAFSVRIQEERKQRVATGGPYAAVRHPGYVGAMAFAPATALMLGSTWALVPAGIAVALLVVRTALEDRTLLRELPGYPDYGRPDPFPADPGHLVAASALPRNCPTQRRCRIRPARGTPRR